MSFAHSYSGKTVVIFISWKLYTEGEPLFKPLGGGQGCVGCGVPVRTTRTKTEKPKKKKLFF